MQLNKARVLTAAAVASLLLLLLILWLCLGITKAFFIFAGIDSAAILAIFVWALLRHSTLDRRLSMARRKAIEGEQIRLEYSFLRKVAGLPAHFRYEQLEAATDNFRAVLGRGASASVFKGILDDGTAVAVKRIEGAEHGQREFRAEVTAIAAVQHVNLVRLLGYCLVPRPGHRYLVYEYIHNGSLDSWIFPADNRAGGQQRCLPWAMRCQVAVDVAKALSYLHHDCRARILHLDVKPENILLDEALRACVADFGLSKLMGKDESRVVTTVRGTRGYLAPEWLLDAGVTEKSDVYSYGMVLLEIVGGRRNVRLVGEGPASQRRWSYFPRIVAEKLREGKIMEVVDGRLLPSHPAGCHHPAGGGGGSSASQSSTGEVDEEEVRMLVQVALWCIQERAELRPSMARVVDMLEGRLPVDAPPETEMIVMDILSIGQSASSPRRLEPRNPAVSTYSISMSVLSPR
ncbi:hypothetical protein Taro_021430 [Colocasia esculenta]|uniref:Protein kinase domain-containing protein n=1 Tax=Colocasia esculenta TaxID=4460 RepID=A0A843UYZ4_COLES|nr:hypothetical protein [Colocasia esculenta]